MGVPLFSGGSFSCGFGGDLRVEGGTQEVQTSSIASCNSSFLPCRPLCLFPKAISAIPGQCYRLRYNRQMECSNFLVNLGSAKRIAQPAV
jgi:hypothetical protein